MKTDWKRKLTSRKLWISVASFVSMLLIALGHTEAEATQVTALIMAGATVVSYVLAEGWADSSHVAGTSTTAYGETGLDEADEESDDEDWEEE